MEVRDKDSSRYTTLIEEVHSRGGKIMASMQVGATWYPN